MTARQMRNYSGEDFCEEERKRLRRILDEEEKTRWLWTTLRFWGAWIAGALAIFVTFKDNLTELIRWLLR